MVFRFKYSFVLCCVCFLHVLQPKRTDLRTNLCNKKSHIFTIRLQIIRHKKNVTIMYKIDISIYFHALLGYYICTCSLFIDIPSLPCFYHHMIPIRALARAASIISDILRAATSSGRTKIDKVAFIIFHTRLFALCQSIVGIETF